MTPTPAEYALRVLLGGDGSKIATGASCIHYGQLRTAPKEAVIVIKPSGFFERLETGGPQSPPTLPLKNISGVPLLFGSPQIEQKATATGIKRMVTSADIVASTFFLLTRYEELARPDVRDEHGRFPGGESLPYKAGFLLRPVVDEYAALLRSWLEDVGVETAESNAPMTVALTHDVDYPYLYDNTEKALRATWGYLLNDPQKILKPMATRLGLLKDPYDTFDWLMTTDGSLRRALGRDRVKSIYFMMACKFGPHDPHYNTAGKRLKHLMCRLRRSGATLGIHPSYAAGGDPARNLREEKKSLERAAGVAISASRNHFLRWREPKDVKWIEKAGLTHDYTMGYADQTGFRLGICRPVRFYDATEMRLTRVFVHPLSIMDVSLCRGRNMGLNFAEALEVCINVVNQIAKHRGELVLLWHNTGLTASVSEEEGYLRALYSEIINYLSKLFD